MGLQMLDQVKIISIDYFNLHLLNARKQLFDIINPVGASGSEAKINTVINRKYNK